MRAWLAMAGVALAGATPRSDAQPAPTGGSFFEPFDRIDEKRWYISDGWTNGNHQGCVWRRDHVGRAQGLLVLKLDNAGTGQRPYGCAEIRTRATLGYGLYEVRMRAAAGSGLNSAMFTYSGPPATNVHDEIDFEFLGKAGSSVQLNYYRRGTGGHESVAPAPGAADGFHTYAFLWAPDAIRWYVDGQLMRTATGDDMPAMPGPLFLSLWSGSASLDGWLGPFVYRGTPLLMAVDWVAFTKAGERCLFPQSLSCTMR